jgi:CBS domain-containing protein
MRHPKRTVSPALAARGAAGKAASAAWIATVPVRALMRDTVVTVTAETPVREEVALMRDRRIRHLPVLDTNGRITGIVTDRDLRQVGALLKLLGERLVRPRPAAAEPGGEYDPGFPAPPGDDPWRGLYGLD